MRTKVDPRTVIHNLYKHSPENEAMAAILVLLIFSSRRHRRWDEGSYGFYLCFFLASSFAYNFVRK